MAWAQLKAIADDNRASWKEVERSRPYLCPIDGFPLVSNSNGTLDCPMGNYQWPTGISVSYKDGII